MSDFSARVAALEAAYGAPSQAAFGSAVFHERLGPDDDLADKALSWYRHFLGDHWPATREDVWMTPWGEVYRRPIDGPHDIVAELRAITDPRATISVPMILDVVDDAAAARSALAAAFDDAATADLRVFTLGDGAAMSGLLVAGEDSGLRAAIFLVFLMD